MPNALLSTTDIRRGRLRRARHSGHYLETAFNRVWTACHAGLKKPGCELGFAYLVQRSLQAVFTDPHASAEDREHCRNEHEPTTDQ
jgi:hypothetical protein